MPQLFASPETAQSIGLDAGESSEMSDKELHQKVAQLNLHCHMQLTMLF